MDAIINSNGTTTYNSPNGKSLTVDAYGNPVINGGMVSNSNGDAIQNLADQLNIKLDTSTKDALLQYYLNSQTEKAKWDRQLDYSKNQYQIAMNDIVKAGLNPVQVFGALSGSNPGTTTANNSRGSASELQQNALDNTVKGATSIASVLAIIAAAVIHAAL